MKIIKEEPGKIMAHQKSYQIGNIMRITKEPRMARRFGFTLNTEHVIVEPPENYLNCGGEVWVNDKKGIPRCLRFYECTWTGKVEKRRKRINQ
jgi:hypothetical protein